MPNETERSVTDRAALRRAKPVILRAVEHFCLLWSSREPYFSFLLCCRTPPTDEVHPDVAAGIAIESSIVDICIPAIDHSRTDSEIKMIRMNGSIVRWCAPVTERAATTKQRFALIAFRSQSFTNTCKTRPQHLFESCWRSAIFVVTCPGPL